MGLTAKELKEKQMKKARARKGAEASSWTPSAPALAPIHPIDQLATFEQSRLKIKEALDLPQVYEGRKSAQRGFLGFFARPNPTRLAALDFITSIATTIKDDQQNAIALINGTYFHVMYSISMPYKTAIYYTDPKSSVLYDMLSDLTDGKTSEEKITCLSSLSAHLTQDKIGAQIKLEQEEIKAILTDIESQIEALATSTHGLATPA